MTVMTRIGVLPTVVVAVIVSLATVVKTTVLVHTDDVIVSVDVTTLSSTLLVVGVSVTLAVEMIGQLSVLPLTTSCRRVTPLLDSVDTHEDEMLLYAQYGSRAPTQALKKNNNELRY